MKNNNLSYIEDQAIIYNEKLLEVKEIINDLEELELDTKVIKEDIKAIEESVSQNIVNNYNLNNPQSECSNSIMQTATSMDYSKAINQLEEIIRLIKDEWKDYYLITQKCHEIKSCLADIENMDFNQIIDTLINILNIMRSSSTINFEIEKKIVNKLYKIIYDVMKLEIIYTNNSRLYDTIKSDETNSMYIVNILKEELDKSKNEDISRLVASLKSQGMNPRNLLDKRLIILMCALNNPELFTEKIEEYILNKEELEKLQEKINSTNSKIDKNNNELNNCINEISNLDKKIKAKKIRTFINAIVISLCLGGGFTLANKLNNINTYHTITTTYDSNTGDTKVIEEYTSGKENSVTIIEKTPWESPGYFRDEDYKRKIYKYKIPTEYLDNHDKPEEYLTEDLKDVLSDESPDTEKSETKPDDYGYGENIYLVTKTQKDLDDIKPEKSLLLFGIIFSISAIGTSIVELIYLKKIDKDRFKVLKKSKKRIIGKQEELNNELQRLNKELSNLKNEELNLKELIKTNESIVSIISNNNPEKAKQFVKNNKKN